MKDLNMEHSELTLDHIRLTQADTPQQSELIKGTISPLSV